MTVVGDGNSTLFWKDSWIEGCCIAQIVPAVLGAVPRRMASTRMVASALADRSWVGDISGAITVQVLLQYLHLWDRLRAVQLLPRVSDSVIWRWSSDRKYSVASAYGAMFIGSSEPFGARLIWNTRAPPKVRFFF